MGRMIALEIILPGAANDSANQIRLSLNRRARPWCIHVGRADKENLETMNRAMIVCRDILRLEYLRGYFGARHFKIAWYEHEESYRVHLAEDLPQVLVADLVGADPAGLAIVRHAVDHYPELPVLAIGDEAAVRAAQLPVDRRKITLVRDLYHLPLFDKQVA